MLVHTSDSVMNRRRVSPRLHETIWSQSAPIAYQSNVKQDTKSRESAPRKKKLASLGPDRRATVQAKHQAGLIRVLGAAKEDRGRGRRGDGGLRDSRSCFEGPRRGSQRRGACSGLQRRFNQSVCCGLESHGEEAHNGMRTASDGEQDRDRKRT
jgi:hypothetical protein